MRTGALVVCVDDSDPKGLSRLFRQWPKKGEVYTVREVTLGREKLGVVKDGKLVPNGGSDAAPGVRVLLQELVNGPDPFKISQELGFSAERFREIETDVETEEVRESVGIAAGETVSSG